MSKKTNLTRFLSFVLMVAMLIGFVPVNKAEASGGLTVGDVPIGSIIVDAGSEWEFKEESGYTGTGFKKPIGWSVVARDHYRAGETTVITDEIIGKHAFDKGGKNHWGNSDVRSFLNATFYDSFGADFKNAVIETELENVAYENKPYTTTDKVWLPSQTEMGLGEEKTHKIGKDFGYFGSDSSRIAKIGSYNHTYWTRSPHGGYSSDVRYVYSAGRSSYEDANDTGRGVRPALHLKSDNPVAKLREGVYTIGKGVEDIRIMIGIDVNGQISSTNYFSFDEIIIPSVIGGIKVTSIGESAFKGNNLTEVIIPDSVVSIGSSAFEGNAISKLNLGNGLKTIGRSSFANNSLTEVSIPAGVNTISFKAFESNPLVTVGIPGNVNITSDAFDNRLGFDYNALNKRPGLYEYDWDLGKWAVNGTYNPEGLPSKEISTANIIVVNDKEVSGTIKGVKIEGTYNGLTFLVSGNDTAYSGTPQSISNSWSEISLTEGKIWIRSIPAFNTNQRVADFY